MNGLPPVMWKGVPKSDGWGQTDPNDLFQTQPLIILKLLFSTQKALKQPKRYKVEGSSEGLGVFELPFPEARCLHPLLHVVPIATPEIGFSDFHLVNEETGVQRG